MKFFLSSHELRSALVDYPASSVPEQPTVGIVVPVYNEIEHLDHLAADLLAQDYSAISEIRFVDGQSDDGTFLALQRLRTRDRRIHVMVNPQRLPATAINSALGCIKSDIVMRLDAHARYQPDVVRQSVDALLNTGAGGVGAIARPGKARTLVGRAIVAAHKSRFGVGVAQFRQEGAEGWVDSVWNGCYWKHVVDKVGPLREDLYRAEDNDFNERVRRLGYGLYLSPAIHAIYQPRQTLQGLWAQYLSNGIGSALALFENPRAIGLRHLAPLALVVSLLLPAAFGLFWPPALLATSAVLLLYGIVLLAATGLAARDALGAHLLLLPVVLVTLHSSYGVGSLWGMSLGLARRVRQRTKRSLMVRS